MGLADEYGLASKTDCGKRDGTVPALARLAGLASTSLMLTLLDEVDCSKVGKSSVSDSGMVSLSGVECPLPVGGGRQTSGLRPS